MPKKSIPAIKKGEVSRAEYTKFITSLKAKVRSAQIRAAVTVNCELIKLYWEIGRDIFEKQEREAWGSKVLERVAKDLQNEFPGIEGFSRANMFRMRRFLAIMKKSHKLCDNLNPCLFLASPGGITSCFYKK